jgi:hypothetical protein
LGVLGNAEVPQDIVKIMNKQSNKESSQPIHLLLLSAWHLMVSHASSSHFSLEK